jgi:peptidoglycan/xylan/chitin deacetylase (PgdA/CDA1 family)
MKRSWVLLLSLALGITLLAPMPATAATGSPFGNYESAVAVVGGISVKGWAIDPDTTAPIYVWVTLDGVGRHFYANVNRPDVGAAFPAFGPSHGFLGTLAATPGTHTVCVTASNVGAGTHTSFGCRTVATALSGSPFGNYESAVAVIGGISVKGWAIDPDTTAPIYVWVTLDGVGRHFYANVNRPDVGAAYPGYGPSHGFLGTVAATPGTHTVCVTASNVGAGSHKALGCRSVTVALPASLLGIDFERIPTTAKVVALSFDGGSGDGAVASILTTLAQKDVRGTFFLTGNFARLFPARVAAITAAGHRLGNHSDTHTAYPSLTNAQIAADLARAEASIVSASGGAPAKPLFRFPFGDRTPADIAAVNDVGYVPVRWTVDTLGWKGTSGGITADIVLERVLATVTPGQIVLMHVGAHPTDGSTLDADALPRIIDELRSRGYTFVTLDVLLG